MGGRFEDVFGRPFLPGIWRLFPSEEMVWAPPIDVVEKEDKFFGTRWSYPAPGGEGREEDVTVSVPYGSFASCLKIEEWTPLEPDFLENTHTIPWASVWFWKRTLKLGSVWNLLIL